MKLFHKIALGALAIALLPLAVLGFSLIRLHRDALVGLISEREQAHAHAVGDRVARELSDVANRVASTARLVDAGALSSEEKTGLLRAIYQQSPDIVSVSWRAKAGELVVPVVSTHAAIDALGSVGAAAARLAVLEPQSGEVAITEPIRLDGRPFPSVFLVCGVGAQRGGERVVVELLLVGAERLLARFRSDDGMRAALLDGGGVPVLAPGSEELLAGFSGERVAPALPPEGQAFRFTAHDGQEMIGALAGVGELGLRVLVFQPEAKAFALVRAMQQRTLVGLGASALLSIVAGLWLSRSLRRRLQAYAGAAQALGRGELGTRIFEPSQDELGLLGATLDQMATALEKSRAEIQAWNRELQERVDARTAELRAAQSRLVQAARLTAVGQLGAGVAHEIGNPLARIIGQAQLLMMDEALPSEARDGMKRIEGAALRVSEITKALLRFSETQNLPAEAGVSLRQCAEEAVALLRTRFEAAGVALTTELAAEPLVVAGKRASIVHALFQLLGNALNASSQGGTVTVWTRQGEAGREIGVRDTGQGIAAEHLEQLFDPFFTTKKVWESPGLGLSLVYRIAEEHGGRIGVSSEVGKGTNVTLTLP